MVLGAQKIPFKAHAWVEVTGRQSTNDPMFKRPTRFGIAAEQGVGYERASGHLEFRWPAGRPKATRVSSVKL